VTRLGELAMIHALTVRAPLMVGPWGVGAAGKLCTHASGGSPHRALSRMHTGVADDNDKNLQSGSSPSAGKRFCDSSLQALSCQPSAWAAGCPGVVCWRETDNTRYGRSARIGETRRPPRKARGPGGRHTLPIPTCLAPLSARSSTADTMYLSWMPSDGVSCPGRSGGILFRGGWPWPSSPSVSQACLTAGRSRDFNIFKYYLNIMNTMTSWATMSRCSRPTLAIPAWMY
jgi:hypothetical protein